MIGQFSGLAISSVKSQWFFGFDLLFAISIFISPFFVFAGFFIIVLLVPAQTRVAPILPPQTQPPRIPSSSSPNGTSIRA
jgi:hypothetical protein